MSTQPTEYNSPEPATTTPVVPPVLPQTTPVPATTATSSLGISAVAKWSAYVDLISKVVALLTWPVVLLVAIAIFYSPLRRIADLLPEKFERSNEIGIGLLSVKIQEQARVSGNEELARIISGLPQTSIDWLLLDRGFARPSMWHHCADAHNGVRLMFDVEKLNTAFKKQVDQAKLFAGPVVYSDDGILLRPGNDPFFLNLTGVYSEQQFMNEINGHLRQWMHNLFFRKLKDWHSEEEFRWVYFDEHSAPLFLTFDDALEGVIIGEKVPKEHEEAFLRYCALYEAEITDLEWRNGYPAIVHPGQPYITHKHLLNT